MKTSTALVKLIVFMVVTSFLTFTLATTIGSIGFGAKTSYKAVFGDVTGLLPGNEIRIAGVRVGQVDEIELNERELALVEFSLDGDRDIPASTIARLRYRNIVGERYIALTESAGSADPLAEGATLPLDQTRNALDLTVLFNGFRPLFQALDPESVNQAAFELIQTLQGEGGTVESLMARTASLTSTLADKDQVIGDRYVQLTPVYEGGPTLPDGALLADDRTAVPVELDEIYESFDERNQTLGPTGANKDGALSDLLDVGGAEPRRNGELLNSTLKDFATLVTTVNDSRGDLFGTVVNLLAAGLESVQLDTDGPDSATAVVAVDQIILTADQAPRTERNRLQMVLVRPDQTWLVERVQRL